MYYKNVLSAAILAYSLLLLLVWFVPLAFMSCDPYSFICAAAYWLTQSAGKYGTLLILLVAGVMYAHGQITRRQQVIVFIRSIFIMLVLLAAFAWVNEHLTKKILMLPRPSHQYIMQQTGAVNSLDSLYELATGQRAVFFQQLVQQNPSVFKNIDVRVLQHWLDEPGLSFPSGHSFNAFLLATLLAFSLRHSNSALWARKYFVLPFIWALLVAVSRVSMGAHSAADVSAGAGLGLLVGLSFLYIDRTRNFILHRKINV